jgi:methionyl-tRNA formyltransferase
MRIVFFGTPDYVLPVVETLHKTFKSKDKTCIVAIVTQSPKPVGRKKILTYSPIDKWAHQKDILTLYKSKELLDHQLDADVGILASFGEIIPKEVINHFPHGILNIHPSLLPKYRGASPVKGALIAGEKETGATIIKLDEELDHGQIVSQFKEEIKKDDTTETLRERLFIQSADVLTTLLKPYLEGKIKPRMQDEKEATFSSLVRKNDAFISPNFIKAATEGKTSTDKWNIPFMKKGKEDFKITPSPERIECFIRAMHPWPIAWTTIKIAKDSKGTKRVKILKAHLDGKKLVLDEVQLEGKNKVTWEQFEQGYPTAMFE